MGSPGIDRGCGRCRSAVVVQAAIVEELEWTDDVSTVLEHPTSVGLLHWMRQQCERGIAQLWRFRDESDCLYVITRLDHDPTEWVVCYARGSGMLKFGRLLLEVARARGWPMRMHTASRATARMCARIGFRLDEYVLRCDHGQRAEREGHKCESLELEQHQHDHVQRR